MVNEDNVFEMVDFRNGVYQGFTREEEPKGMGLFLDDQSVLYCSDWVRGVPEGRTAVFVSHGKYFYGEWKNGKPQGFNIFRCGDVVLLGNYVEGHLIGRFMLIFEKQSFVTIVSGSEQKTQNIEKKYYSTDEQLKFLTNRLFQSVAKPEDFFSFVFFLKHSFCLDANSPLKLEMEEGDLRFGYPRGLGVIFDQDNYIYKLGYIDEKQKMAGLGVIYGMVNEEGNFDTKNTVRYNTGQKPKDKLRRLFKSQHQKSIHFRNNFLTLKSEYVLEKPQHVVNSLIDKMVDISGVDMSQEEHMSSSRSKNQPKQVIKKTIDSGEKIQRMKSELLQSVGRIGSEIRPQLVKKESALQGTKQLYFPPQEEGIEDQEGISFKGPISNAPYANRRQFIDNNSLVDYRHRYDRVDGFVNKTHVEVEEEDDLKMFRRQPEQLQESIKYYQQQQKKGQKTVVNVLDVKSVESTAEKERVERVSSQMPSPKKPNIYRVQNVIDTSVAPVVQQVTKPQTKDFINQTSFSSEHSNSIIKKRSLDPLESDNHNVYRVSPDKASSFKMPLPEIHFNPFLGTYVSSKYPVLPTEQLFKKIEKAVNEPLRPDSPPSQHFVVDRLANQYDQDRDANNDSLEELKKDKQYKPSRYLIEEDSPRIPTKLQNPSRPSKSFTPGRNALPLANSQSPSTQTLHQQRIIQKPATRGYVQIYRTSTNFKPKASKSRSRSPTPTSGLTWNPIRGVLSTPPRETLSKKLREYSGEKVIDIQHLRISPEGKRTTSREKIVKKYHYIKN